MERLSRRHLLRLRHLSSVPAIRLLPGNVDFTLREKMLSKVHFFLWVDFGRVMKVLSPFDINEPEF